MNSLHEMADDMAEAAPAINARFSQCRGDCSQGHLPCAAEACSELGFEDDQSQSAAGEVAWIIFKMVCWVAFAGACFLLVAGLV